MKKLKTLVLGLALLAGASVMAGEWSDWGLVGIQNGVKLYYRVQPNVKDAWHSEANTMVQFKAENTTTTRKSVTLDKIKYSNMSNMEIDNGTGEAFDVSAKGEYTDTPMAQKPFIKKVKLEWTVK